MLLSLDASNPTRNGFVHLLRETQKPTEGTEHGSLERVKGAKSNYFRRNQMAQVTYRGVNYDTEEYNKKVLEEATKRQRHDLMYRGVKVQRKMVGA